MIQKQIDLMHLFWFFTHAYALTTQYKTIKPNPFGIFFIYNCRKKNIENLNANQIQTIHKRLRERLTHYIFIGFMVWPQLCIFIYCRWVWNFQLNTIRYFIYRSCIVYISGAITFVYTINHVYFWFVLFLFAYLDEMRMHACVVVFSPFSLLLTIFHISFSQWSNQIIKIQKKTQSSRSQKR